MMNAPPDTKDRRMMRVADKMYDLCSELAELLPQIPTIRNPREVLLTFAKRGRYWSTKYDDEMSTDDPVPTQASPQLPLGEDIVKTVASLVTEDPDERI